MKCYLTYDYELFLGRRTGTPEGCLVEPLSALTSVFDKYGVKVNLFVDAAYLLRLKTLKDNYTQLEKDYITVTNHIKELSSKGHSIQLHFHPQWIKAKFEHDVWHLDNEHYKLSDYTLDIQKEYLSQAIDLLQSLAVNRIKAFRAGGFSIENFDELSPFFLERGIIIDTSVLRGGFVVSKYQSYDYRHIPLLTSYCFAANNKEVKQSGEFLEYPISVMELNSLSYLYYKNIKKRKREIQFAGYSSQKWNDGVGIGESTSSSSRLKNYIDRLFAKSPLYASADGTLVYFLPDVYEYCKTRYTGDEFVILGHPKIATPRSVAVLENFIAKYKEDIEFVTFD